jgi:hypothetical protein
MPPHLPVEELPSSASWEASFTEYTVRLGDTPFNVRAQRTPTGGVMQLVIVDGVTNTICRIAELQAQGYRIVVRTVDYTTGLWHPVPALSLVPDLARMSTHDFFPISHMSPRVEVLLNGRSALMLAPMYSWCAVPRDPFE